MVDLELARGMKVHNFLSEKFFFYRILVEMMESEIFSLHNMFACIV